MTREKEKNNRFIKSFMILLSARVVMEFLNVVLNGYLHLSSTSLITLAIYSLLFIYFAISYFKYKTSRIRDFVWLFGVYLFYLISYIFSDFKSEYLNTGMIFLYAFYLPFSFLIVSNITNWDQYEKISSKFNKPILMIGFLTMFLSFIHGSSDSTTYMTVSYAILPIICTSFLCLVSKKDFFLLILLLLNLVSMVFYGARMPLFLAIIMFALCFYKKARLFGKILCIVVVVLVVCLSSGVLERLADSELLNKLADDYNIHIFNQLLKGELFSSGGRDEIYKVVGTQVSLMGSNIYGLFGDRYFVSSYSHSIIYESLLSFGWLFGCAFLLVLLLVSLSAFFKSITLNREMVFICFFISFFCKFFVSSSFAIDYSFPLYLCLTLSFLRIKIKNRKINEYEYSLCNC